MEAARTTPSQPQNQRQIPACILGGLRGALALAVALSLTTAFPYREQILNLTFGVVIFSILVQGLTIKPLVRILKLANGGDAKAL